jgi:geranylgeranyl diphosphate synthase, type I
MDLSTELGKRVAVFDSYWLHLLPVSDPARLYEAARHLPLGGGKRMRPAITMLACESVFGDPKSVLPFGAALELMHNFTLVHDDIMDKSLVRRSLQTVHVKYGEATAILAGDLLFAKAFQAMLELDIDPEMFKELDGELVQCILDICEGQELDMDFERRKSVTEKEYIHMISKKTGVLFQLAAKGGARVGGGSVDEVDALARYGMFLGLSFQIWDDYLDMSSNVAVLGKDIGNDIRNGKKTLIAVHCLGHASAEQKRILEKMFGNRAASEDEVRSVLEVFRASGSIEYARSVALGYNQEAKAGLAVLPDSLAKQTLGALADFAISREK